MHKGLMTYLMISTLILTACQANPNQAAQITGTGLSQGTMSPPPGGFGSGGPGGMGMPGGLPPNIEEIRSKYPELATALESMQTLSPEERRSKLDALFAAHPEYMDAMRPPQGMMPPRDVAFPAGAPSPAASPTV